MSFFDQVIDILFKTTIFGYGIVGYAVYHLSKKVSSQHPKLPVIVTIISLVLSFWYLPTLPVTHWRTKLFPDLRDYEKYSVITDHYSELTFLTPVELLYGWGDKNNHLLEVVNFKYPSTNPVYRELLDVDCIEKTIEKSIPKDKSYKSSLETQKLNALGKEVLEGQYYTPKNSRKKMSDTLYKLYCDIDWSIKKENVLQELNHKK